MKITLLVERKQQDQREQAKIDSRIHKIDIDMTISQISKDDFLLSFMVDGLYHKNFNQIPKIYNLMMTLRISAISVIILCLQSSSFMQSLLLIIIEMVFLGIIVKYQTEAKALKSRVIFWARVMESTTLALYGLVCLFYSFKSESLDSWGRVASYPAFTIFVATLVFEYFALVYSVSKAIKEALSSKKKIVPSSRKIFQYQDERKDGTQNDGITTKSRNKAEKDLLKYWITHQFIIIKKKNSPLLDQGQDLIPKSDQNQQELFKNIRREGKSNQKKNSRSKEKELSKAKVLQTSQKKQRKIPKSEAREQEWEENPFQRPKGAKKGLKTYRMEDRINRNLNPIYRRSKQKRRERSRLRRDQIYF